MSYPKENKKVTEEKRMNLQTAIDKVKFAGVVAEAVAKLDPNSADTKRWLNCIARATVEIEENPFLDFTPETKTLLIFSIHTSNKIYQANGSCQCKAYEYNRPCWHLAACRLICRYFEAQ